MIKLHRALLWVRWYPKDATDGMSILLPMEELAYRRVLDMIFINGNQLPDNDRVLAWSTKAGRGWQKIKARLIELGKIEIVDGFVTNRRATEVCIETASFIAQKSAAGTVSAERRKANVNPLKDKPLDATVVDLSLQREERKRGNGTATIQQLRIRKKISNSANSHPLAGGAIALMTKSRRQSKSGM